MVLLNSLPFWIKGAAATDHGTGTPFPGSINTTQVSALAHASLNTPVNASDPNVGIFREDVLNVYPSNFTVYWDRIPTTSVATWVYQFCGLVATTTCEIRENDFCCRCMNGLAGVSFGAFETIPEQDLNTPVRASGRGRHAIPTFQDVAQIYPVLGFSVDWTVVHDGTVAAGILFDACGMLPTTCILEEARLECLCRDFDSPVLLGYKTFRPGPNVVDRPAIISGRWHANLWGMNWNVLLLGFLAIISLGTVITAVRVIRNVRPSASSNVVRLPSFS
jgi:hypothetical protein